MIDPMTQQRILVEILRERARQDEKWGEQHHPDVDPGSLHLDYRTHQASATSWKLINAYRVDKGALAWDGILLEEAYEAAGEEDTEKKIAELIQVAAVAVCWIEDLKSRDPEQLALFEVG